MPQGGARRAAGLAVTAIGLLLFAYAIAAAIAKGHIGSDKAWTPDAVAILLGWFMLMLGPAIAFGETPASLRPVESGARGR